MTRVRQYRPASSRSSRAASGRAGSRPQRRSGGPIHRTIRQVNARALARVVVGIVLLVALLAVFWEGQPLQAQTTSGATLTVLRGAAAVRKADGTPLSPAPSGLTI